LQLHAVSGFRSVTAITTCPMAQSSDVTTLLAAFSKGDRAAGNALLPLVYNELRRIARRRRAHLAPWHGPGTTSLVHEACANMLGAGGDLEFESRSHFFYLASVAIRNLLVDHAKYASRQKRAGIHEELSEALAIEAGPPAEEILAIDEALHRLAAEDERLAKIVECRFFGGYTVEETAESLGLSPSTVKRGWDTARAWLYGQLKSG